MRTMLMSFKPSVYYEIKNGTKIFEHRRVFPDELVKVYMYVSSPICAIAGIIYLGNRHALTDWEKEYDYDKNAVSRIKKYEKKYNYAMEILRFQETNVLELHKLRNELSRFVVPQMYYYLEDSELLTYLEKNIYENGKTIKHSFDSICSNQLCLH